VSPMREMNRWPTDVREEGGRDGDTCSCCTEDAAFLFGVREGELGGHFVGVVCGRDKILEIWISAGQHESLVAE
jgi:hypothetical protein